MTKVKVELDRAALKRLSSPGGMIDASVAKAAGRVRDNAKRIIYSEGRVQTGALAQSIVSQRSVSSAAGAIYTVSSDLKYAIYQHEGVRGPIYPRRAKMLRFKVGGRTVFARSVRGFKGIKFLERALRELSAADYA